MTDALLGGDITAAFNFPNPFPVGDSASADFTYTPGANEDPVENSVSASGDGVDSGVTATASDSCDTDITHEPGIDVVKECPESVSAGEDVVFTITVTNTGNEPLENLFVTDALLGGNITAAFSFPNPFPVGDSASADFTYTPGRTRTRWRTPSRPRVTAWTPVSRPPLRTAVTPTSRTSPGST